MLFDTSRYLQILNRMAHGIIVNLGISAVDSNHNFVLEFNSTVKKIGMISKCYINQTIVKVNITGGEHWSAVHSCRRTSLLEANLTVL